jgi:hypothetical protein
MIPIKRIERILRENNIDFERVYPTGKVKLYGGRIINYRQLLQIYQDAQTDHGEFSIISTDDEVIIDGPPDGWDLEPEMIPNTLLNDVRDIYRSSETVEDNVEVVEEQPNKKRGRKPKGAEDV